MGYLEDYYKKNKKKNPLSTTTPSGSSPSTGYLTEYQQKNKLASPFDTVKPTQKKETAPIKASKQEVKSTSTSFIDAGKQTVPSKKDQKKSTSFIGKVGEIASGVADKVGSFLFGDQEKKIISPIPQAPKKPRDLKMSEEDYIKAVPQIEKLKFDARKRLDDAERELMKTKLERPGPLTPSKDMTMKDTQRAVDEVQLVNEIPNLKKQIEIYDQFLGKEPIDRGFVQSLWAGMKNPGEMFIPFAKDSNAIQDLVKTYSVAQKYKTGEKLSNYEKSQIQKLQVERINQVIDHGIAYKAGEVVTDVPHYLLEFAMTSGGYSIGKNLTTQAIKKVTKDQMPEVATKLVSSSIGSIAQGTLMVPRYTNDTLSYMLPGYEVVTDKKGESTINKLAEGEGFGKALTKAYLSNLVETVSERLGVVVEKPMDFLMKATIGKFIEKRGFKTVGEFATIAKEVGWNGIVGEVFEEEIGELAQAPIEERKYYAPLVTPEGTERLLVETLGIAAFGGIAKINDTVIETLTSNQTYFKENLIDIPVDNKVNEVIEEESTLPPIIQDEFDQQKAEVEELQKKIRIPEKFSSELEEKSLTELQKDPVGFRDRYIEEHDNIVNPDLMRPVFKEYKGYNTNEFNRFARALTEITYDRLLDTRQGERNNTVLLTAGGPGSAKSSFLSNEAIISDIKEYPAILDTTSSSKSAGKNIEKALDKGYDAQILFVLRNPTEAWENGVLPRAKNIGRIVTEGYFLKSHENARKNILEAYEKYKDNPKVSFVFVDNTGTEAKLTSVEEIKKFSYNRAEAVKLINNATEKAYEQQNLTKEQYEEIKKDRESTEPTKDSSGSERSSEEQSKDKLTSDTSLNREKLSLLNKVKKGIKVYRSGKPSTTRLGANFFSTDINVAKDFSLQRGTPVEEYIVKLNNPYSTEDRYSLISELFDKETAERVIIKGNYSDFDIDSKGAIDPSQIEESIFIPELKKKGYDGLIMVSGQSDKPEVVTFSKESALLEKKITSQDKSPIDENAYVNETERIARIVKEYENKTPKEIRTASLKAYEVGDTMLHYKLADLYRNEMGGKSINHFKKGDVYVDIWRENTGKFNERKEIVVPVIGNKVGKVKNLETGEILKTYDHSDRRYVLEKDFIEKFGEINISEELLKTKEQLKNIYNKVKGSIIESNEQTSTVQPTGVSDTGEVRSSTDRGQDTVVDEVSQTKPPSSSSESGDRSRGAGTTRGGGKVSRQDINTRTKEILESKEYSTNQQDYTADELKILESYTGAGGKESAGATGKGLLSEYYTPPEIVQKVWDIISVMKKGTIKDILEPSIGTGAMVKLAPKDADIVGYEYQKVSGTIAQLFNPDAYISIGNGTEFNNNGDFQNRIFEPIYDVVVGNPPFGERNSFLKGKGEEPKINRWEEYFIKRGLDSLANDGVLVYVVNSSFLNKSHSPAKSMIGNIGELVRAYRLPEGLFADTSIGTDIVVFKKTKGGDVARRVALLSDNRYFENNPDDVLGEIKTRKNKFGKEEKYVSGTIKDLNRLNVNPVEVVEVVTSIKPVEKKSVKVKAEKTLSYAERTRQKIGKSVKALPAIIPGSKNDTEVIPVQTLTGKKTLNKREIELLKKIKIDGSVDYSEENRDVLNFNGGQYYHDFNYFSGDIYEKLSDLEIDKDRMTPQQYEKQLKGLKKVLPQKLTVEKIEFDPLDRYLVDIEVDGSPMITNFTRWVSNGSNNFSYGVRSWDITNYVLGRRARQGTKNIMGDIKKDSKRLFNFYIKNVLDPEIQTTISDTFNKEKNSYVNPQYELLPIQIKGMAKYFRGKEFRLSNTQIGGVSMLSTKGAGLVAYGVGVGKTHTLLAATMASHSKGWNKRPLFVVPKSTLAQTWIATIKAMFPEKTIVNLGGLTQSDILKMQVARGKNPSKWIRDGEISVITHEGLMQLGLKEEELSEAVADLSDVLTRETTKRGDQKQIEKFNTIVGLAQSKTSNIFLTDLGIDHISVDEVHNFRKVFQGAKPESLNADGTVDKSKSKRFANVIGGTPSKRAQQLFLISQYILKRNDGRGVYLASATPFENHATEVYNILSFVARARLKRMGIQNINDFYSIFSDFQTEMDFDVRNQPVQREKMKSFKNLSTLQKLLREFIDYQVDKTLIRPDKKIFKPQLQMSPEQESILTKIQEMLNPAEGDAEDGAVLKAVTYSVANSISPYFVKEFYPEVVDGVTLVENSPKIKYAMNIVKNIKSNPKTKSLGVFLYLGSNGVNYHPVLEKYIIDKLHFKSSEVAYINGQTKEAERELIKEKFNDGTVKVLIGGDPTKEGIDLQKNGYTTINLALGWNPTEMMQVEGRVWRQGNPRNIAPIIYPLVENSGDTIIYNKFEEKASRTNDLFSYQGQIFDVGEVDPKEIRLALTTDPEKKAKLEIELDRAVIQDKLAMIESELGNIRKIDNRLPEIKTEISDIQEQIKSGKTSWGADLTNDQKIERKNRIKRLKKEQSGMQAFLDREKITDISVKILELQNLNIEYDSKLEAVKNTFDEKFAKFKKEHEAMIAARKSEKDHIDDFIKGTESLKILTSAEMLEKKNELIKQEKEIKYTTPSGTADVGGYSDIQSAQKLVEDIKSIEFPEILRITKELMGNTPTLRNFPRALGKFYSDATTIRLSPEIFKDPQLAAKVLAHELGHLTDFLPTRTLKRGNLLGRIMSMKKYLKRIYGKDTDEEISNNTVRTELRKLTQLWKPFDVSVSKSFTAYRYSPAELYADAISVLFNDPALLKETAPTFWRGFFDYIDKKPEVKENFIAMWDLLNKGEEEVFRARDKELDKSFQKGEEAFVTKYLEKQKKKSILYHLKLLFDDKNTPIKQKINEVQKNGGIIPSELNPDYALKGILYSESELKNYIADNFQPVYEKANEIPGGWEKLGKILFYERVVNERGELANPQGYSPKTAQDQLKNMEEAEGESWTALQEAKTLFREAVQRSIDIAEKNEYYTPELIQQMKANPAYASFQVVDYLDTYITARVYHQVGTLKDIANPATSTVMKLISLHKAIKRNNVKKLHVSFLDTHFKGSIIKAKTKWNGKSLDILPSKDPALGLIITIEKGKPQGYYTERDIAEMLTSTSSQILEAAARISRIVSQSAIYRPLFTVYNLGFQSFNFIRDIRRSWRNFPQKTLLQVPFSPIIDTYRVAAGYTRAILPSAKRSLGMKDRFITEMENANILGLTYNDIYSGEIDQEQKQIDRILQETGILAKTKKKNIFTPFVWVLDKVGTMGDFVETLPKVAGYIELKGTMPIEELAEFLRTSVGSPAFRVGGALTPVTNNIFLFSNAIKEGIKSDIKVAIGKKGGATAAGFWWKTLFSDFLPTFIMAAIAYGFFGDDLEELMDKVSEYDKTNYTIIPLYRDENGKTVYIRVPHDETGRFMKGLLWKIITLNKDKASIEDFFDIFSFGAGQIPSLSPVFTGGNALIAYLSGNNPYDSFRNRNIIPDTEFKAGFKESFPIFLDWLIKNQGAGIILPGYKTENQTNLEKTLTKPGISNILGRWVRVSDYGSVETLKEISTDIEKANAQRLLTEREIIDTAIKDYNKKPSLMNKLKLEREIVEKIVIDKKDKTKKTNTLKKFRIGIIRGEGDPNINSLIDAGTNAEKVELLISIEKKVSTNELNEIIKTAKKNKIISSDVLLQYKKKKK